MKITSFPLPTKATLWPKLSPEEFPDSRSTLVLILASSGHAFHKAMRFAYQKYPSSTVVGINGGIVFDERHTNLKSTVWVISLSGGFFRAHATSTDDDVAAGYQLGCSLTDFPTSVGADEQIRGALLLVGRGMNGESVMNGVNSVIQGDIPIIGAASSGLSPDDESWISIDGELLPKGAVAISIHGDVRVGFGWGSGWTRHPKAKPFRVTKATGTLVQEINGRPAYPVLMEMLQATGLSIEDQRKALLRNPLALDEAGDLTPDRIRVVYDILPEQNAVRFIGNIKTGSSLTWCQSSPEKLADGAAQAVQSAAPSADGFCGMAFTFTSCGRMALFGPHLESECDALRSKLPPGARMAGISTHGQVAPLTSTTPISAWLNQTVSILYLSESTLSR